MDQGLEEHGLLARKPEGKHYALHKRQANEDRQVLRHHQCEACG
jgi:hypothetical protein